MSNQSIDLPAHGKPWSAATEVILICDRQGLIGRQMFVIDWVKLPGNADRARSGTHAALAHHGHA